MPPFSVMLSQQKEVGDMVTTLAMSQKVCRIKCLFMWHHPSEEGQQMNYFIEVPGARIKHLYDRTRTRSQMQ